MYLYVSVGKIVREREGEEVDIERNRQLDSRMGVGHKKLNKIERERKNKKTSSLTHSS